jgi:cyclic beta-1,2-glucan synthetase
VGYALGGPVDFTSHYDLLASESRLASLVSIAKRDVPLEHWFAMGRPRGGSGRHQILLSWSGTMFEYLMPLLFARTYANSLLDQAVREAVARQIEYGHEKRVPWGISESAYSALDDHRVYQYRAFGVPALALHPDMESEPVVAPYSTVLALMVDPAASLSNLRRLDALGLAGPMGFYEAIDFARASKRGGLPGVVIYAYMAHHEGMSLLALDNTLFDGNMQRRFHQDPRVRAVEPLLFERVPTVKLQGSDLAAKPVPVRESPVEEPVERTWTEETPFPRAYLYGNGRYALMITNSGSGYSRWKDFDLTRWRADTTLDDWGSYLYIRDLRSGRVWSAAHQPVTESKQEAMASFSADHVEFHRNFVGVETVLSVTVAPDDDAELRRLVVTNHSRRTRQLEFTSYLELALAPPGADAAHPAFNKLFIETEYPEEGVLLARRRPRSPEDPPVWCAHVITGAPGAIQFETDRRMFLGRSRTARSPKAMETDLSGSVGCVLDPIFSLRCSGSIPPRARIDLAFATLAAGSREGALALAAKYKRREAVARAFEMAWTHAQLEFRFLQIGPGAGHRYQELANHLIYPNSRLRPSAARLAQNHLGQPALWGLGISGDLPILTVTVADSSALPLVHDALAAHAYWRLRGFRADLVILNQEAAGYDRPLHHQLQRQIDAYSREAGTDRPGGVFLRDSYTVSEEQQLLILEASRAVLSGSRGSLERQLRGIGENPRGEVFVPLGGGKEEPSAPLPFLELPYFNGLGGFTQDGREYAIYLGPGAVTPTPWINVIASPRFGTLVSESGLGFTWRGNSQQNRLTSWRNDPVSDIPSEVIYLRDEESGARWTPTALPIREQDAYRARHSQGYTVFEHNSHAIAQELTVFVPIGENGDGDPVKVCRLRLRNDSSRRRRLTATFFAEWVLGNRREDQQAHIRTARDEESGALFAYQNWTGQNPECVAFAASSPKPDSFTGDRRAFLGRNRSFSNPVALDNAALDNRASAGLDPAAALQVRISLDPGHEADVVFLLGQAESAEEARAIISRYQSIEQVYRALSATWHWWETKLLAVQVHTPLLSVDFLLNRWLPYQALSCRFWGRSALYQSSGAFGFRDQLQDSMALLYLNPEFTRRHILASAARQFFEGDVQHWWHPETGLGVRTRCSDDLLWLPYVVARYVEVTGDASVLEESVPFIEGPPLAEHEQERVFVPDVSPQSVTVWDHCCQALDYAWRLGPHNLPLIGNGDWNDGLNHVGVEGRGESAWLGWFQCAVLESFAWLAERRQPALAVQWRERAANLSHTMEQVCWDGEWYLRGFFDDGSQLGSHLNQEARIDSLPQSWAVISGAAEPHRARSALEAADRNLVREAEKLVLLFTPPFDRSAPNPGYIMGYPPGIRENGGQYTHGSLWLTQAWARLGEGSNAVRLLNMMNPVELCRDPEAVERYRGEPYVAAADVYSAPGKEGQCGWTWYTGSAGWMYRIWVEEVLGLQLRGTRLSVQPVIPAEWPGFEITFRYRSATYRIVVEQGSSSPAMELDGATLGGDFIELADDGRTHVFAVRVPLKVEHVKLLGPGFKEAVPTDGLRPESALPVVSQE